MNIFFWGEVPEPNFVPALGCPRFSVQRRQPQAGDVEQGNAVQPQSPGLRFLGFQVLGFARVFEVFFF